jgi:hypothetical protein
MTKPKPHDSDSEVDPLADDEPTTARLDLLSAYTMFGRMQLDGLLAHSVRATAEEVAPLVEPLAGEDDGYYYKEPGENTWRAA